MKAITIFLIFFSLCACKRSQPLQDLYQFSKPPIQNKSTQNGGVVITFDDAYVDDWYALDSLMKQKYPWKATFCVAYTKSLKIEHLKKLKYLQDNGHEIGFHGDSHTPVVSFLKSNSWQDYIDKDFRAGLDILKEFKIYSFAYPNGQRSELTDQNLLKSFSILRAVSSTGLPANKELCFYDGSPVVYAIGIEEHYKYFSEDYLKSLLDFAHVNKKVLILYCHRPVRFANPKNHEASYSTFEFIGDYVKAKGMSYLRLQDLAPERNGN
jgi:peptidoglycan/xylan/chitin deacetylase (PgdA/CDA1 family)